MDRDRAIRTIALRDVLLADDLDYHRRRIMRDYSERWSTPLHVVYDLPWEFVLQAYYEAVYERLSAGDQNDLGRLAEDRELLTQTEEERRAAVAEEEERERDLDELRDNLAREEGTPPPAGAEDAALAALRREDGLPAGVASDLPPDVDLRF